MNNHPLVFPIFAAWCLALAPAIEAQTLPVTHDLLLWLKADALSASDNDPVPVWSDSSGNGYDFANGSAANQPTYVSNGFGGKPILRFDGTSAYLTNVNFHFIASLPALTFFFVHKIDADPPASNIQSGFARLGQGALSHYPFSDGVIYDTTGSAVRYTTGNPTLDLTRPHIYTVESTSSLWRNSLNGVPFFTFSAANTVAINDATRPNSIGISDPLTTTGVNARFFDGDMAEILIYNTALTSVERQDVTEYLVAKWAIPEPSAVVLLALCGLAARLRRRR
jgi:hypothetical protein